MILFYQDFRCPYNSSHCMGNKQNCSCCKSETRTEILEELSQSTSLWKEKPVNVSGQGPFLKLVVPQHFCFCFRIHYNFSKNRLMIVLLKRFITIRKKFQDSSVLHNCSIFLQLCSLVSDYPVSGNILTSTLSRPLRIS